MNADPFVVRMQAQDVVRRANLRKMKRIALACLVFMLVLYLLAQFGIAHFANQAQVWRYVSAFAEAAMIGALADWFAVVALFRHPLGVPIPHTAIIPDSKTDIARNLGEFIVTHFITPQSILPKLQAFDPASQLAQWFLNAGNKTKLANALIEIAANALNQIDEHKMRILLRTTIQKKLTELDLSALIAQLIDLTVEQQHHQELLNTLLIKLQTVLEEPEQQQKLAALLGDALDLDGEKMLGKTFRSIINRFMPRVAARLQATLIEVHADSRHPWRNYLDQHIAEFIARLREDENWQHKIEEVKNQWINQPDFALQLEGAWDTIKKSLQSKLQKNDPQIVQFIEKLSITFADRIHTDEALHNWANERIFVETSKLIEQQRGNIGQFITQEVEAWSEAEMVERIELTIGRDLQFIRINGTLVGGIIGVLIYALSQYLPRWVM